MRSAAEQEQEVLQQKVNDVAKVLDRLYMRPLQKEAFKCMANCLDNEALEGAALDRCSRRCTELLERVKHAVEHDMNELQERVSRGVQLCNDQATDMLGERSEPDPAMRERAEKFADECAAKSLKSHTSFISAIQQRVSRIVE